MVRNYRKVAKKRGVVLVEKEEKALKGIEEKYEKLTKENEKIEARNKEIEGENEKRYFDRVFGSIEEFKKTFNEYVEGAREIDRGLRSAAAVWAIIWSIPFVRVMLIFGAIISIWKMVMRKRNE